MNLINLILVLYLYIDNINYIHFVTYPSDGLITQYNNDNYPIYSSKEYQKEWLREKSLYYK
ncbi:MAG: hypothetical protein KC589_02715 [Nanoarchaeota archaeon]|nr:hypothetical protein [Nanoarchaeota archaeon]